MQTIMSLHHAPLHPVVTAAVICDVCRMTRAYM